MSDLVQWLRDQLDVDERIASRIHDESDCSSLEYGGSFKDCDCGWPTRVLAEVAAKRAILDFWASTKGILDFVTPVTLKHLALPYADRPGWDDTWRISTS